MKLPLVLALLFASPAVADPIDDYVACLIGRSAVTLHSQPFDAKDSGKAQEAAYESCVAPPFPPDMEPDGLEDFVNLAVESIASGVWPSQ